MFNKEKNVIYVYCPDINVYNSSVDLMYDYADVLKANTDYNVFILHAKDNFGHINWKNKPECEIKYLTSDIHFDEEDILMFPIDNIAVLFSIKPLKVRKIPIVVEAYNFIAASLFTTKNSAALPLKELDIERVLVLDNDCVLGKCNIDTLLRGFFRLDDVDIVHQPFNYINAVVYNDVMESITEPTVKPLEDGTFTVEDVVKTQTKDIDVLIKVGHAVSNTFVGYLANNNEKGWALDFIDYTMSESTRADKLKKAKVYIDSDNLSLEKIRAELCGASVIDNVIDKISNKGLQSLIDEISECLNSDNKPQIKNLKKKYSKITLIKTKDMIDDDSRKQTKADQNIGQ
jgi:hypothetical protein